ncbi:hypothetical protein FGO68_gene2784 [Halteria grandinella]|uniref:Uncharacterized protein n=1 Tax=Halteria grandinella TaxID=5974 RepID=A0A8J8SZI1_HALGN|nr:hypothetical protein FGO68_gene2784 [Halteria grandinella]
MEKEVVQLSLAKRDLPFSSSVGNLWRKALKSYRRGATAVLGSFFPACLACLSYLGSSLLFVETPARFSGTIAYRAI